MTVAKTAKRVGDILANSRVMENVYPTSSKVKKREFKADGISAVLKNKNKVEAIMKRLQADLGCDRGNEFKSVIKANHGMIFIDGTKMRDKLLFDLIVRTVEKSTLFKTQEYWM